MTYVSQSILYFQAGFLRLSTHHCLSEILRTLGKESWLHEKWLRFGEWNQRNHGINLMFTHFLIKIMRTINVLETLSFVSPSLPFLLRINVDNIYAPKFQFDSKVIWFFSHLSLYVFDRSNNSRHSTYQIERDLRGKTSGSQTNWRFIEWRKKMKKKIWNTKNGKFFSILWKLLNTKQMSKWSGDETKYKKSEEKNVFN